MTNISRVFQERLQRQINAHPQLANTVVVGGGSTVVVNSSAQTLAWNDFLRAAHNKPFFCQWELDKDMCVNESNCWSHLVGLPLDRKHQPKNLYDYEAYVSHKMGVQIGDKNILTTFAEENKISDEKLGLHKSESELNNNKNIAILKATNMGITELILRIMCYKATVNDDLRGSTMVTLVGPNFSLAILLIQRIRQMFFNKLGLLFEGAQDAIKLNGIRVESKPSHHIDILRSETNISFIHLSESSFFPLQDNESILSAILHFRAKSDPWIVLESTPNKVGDLMHRIFHNTDSLEYYTFEKLELPYTMGMPDKYGNKRIYDPELIKAQMQTVGFQREYNLQFINTSSNIFSQSSIDVAITKDYDLRGIPQAPKAIGCDPSTGGDSSFSFTLIQCAFNKIQILRQDNFKAPINFNQMINHCISLMRQYQNVHNIFCDAAVPIYWQAVTRLNNQRTDYEQNVKELREWRYSDESIMRKLVVHPIAFGPNHKRLLANTKFFLDSNVLQIHPMFTQLITALRGATAIEYDLIKSESPENDALDSLRLSLNFVKPKQPIPTLDQLQTVVENNNPSSSVIGVRGGSGGVQ